MHRTSAITSFPRPAFIRSGTITAITVVHATSAPATFAFTSITLAPTPFALDSPPTISVAPTATLRPPLLTTALTLAAATAIAPERAPAFSSAAALSLWTAAASSGSARAEPTTLVTTTGCAASFMCQSVPIARLCLLLCVAYV